MTINEKLIKENERMKSALQTIKEKVVKFSEGSSKQDIYDTAYYGLYGKTNWN